MNENVGIIGLGNIGMPLALNLLRSGIKVVGYSKDDFEPFVCAGGIAAGSAAEVAERCDVIFQSLPTVAALDDVAFGPSGVLKTIRPGSTIIELSTYPLEVKQRLALGLAEAGSALLDCEMIGNPVMVAGKRNLILVSGDPVLAERMQPLLRQVSSRAPYLGPLGTSLRMKLVSNMLSAVHTLAAAEAIRLAQKSGIDPHLAVDLLGSGAASSVKMHERGPRMAARNYAGSSGLIDAFYKYVELGEPMARSVGADTPLFDATLPYFRRALDEGRGKDDISVVYELLR